MGDGQRDRQMTRDQSNLRLSFKPATLLLRQCSCVTVSSTAAMESMAMGISTRIVGDRGDRNPRQPLLPVRGPSPALPRLANLELIHDAQWLEQQGLQRDGEDRFITALVDRLNRPAAP